MPYTEITTALWAIRFLDINIVNREFRVMLVSIPTNTSASLDEIDLKLEGLDSNSHSSSRA